MIDQTKAYRASQVRRGKRRKVYQEWLAYETRVRYGWFVSERGLFRNELVEPWSYKLERARLMFKGYPGGGAPKMMTSKLFRER